MSDLPLDLPPPEKRKRRRDRKPSVTRRRVPPSQPALLRAPDVQRCGFCGLTVTVLQDVARCPRCDAIVARTDPSERDA